MHTEPTEANARIEVNNALVNKGWQLKGVNGNVVLEKHTPVGKPDYILLSSDGQIPLAVIETKRKGENLDKALEQAKRYAQYLKAPIIYATDGTITKTLHLKENKPLILNDEEVETFLDERLTLQYVKTHIHDTRSPHVKKSRAELVPIFEKADKILRKEGFQQGLERFSEFCNILFLKVFSEQEEVREQKNKALRIEPHCRWEKFKDKKGRELLAYVNDTVIKHLQSKYQEDIFAPLQIKNPSTLATIIDQLSPLTLSNIDSDIKGDAFEYFLKAYSIKQHKDIGEYFTPRHIVKVLVKLLNPKYGETIYDPFCGTGGMLIEVFKHVYDRMPRKEAMLKKLKEETIYGNEITKNARITKMNMILTGDGHSNIQQQDSLKNRSEKKYDMVITNMPFSLGSFPEYADKYMLGSANGNSLCIEHCLDAINTQSENPRLGIIVPEGILFDKKYAALRSYIYKNSTVENIISLPQGAFMPYTNVKTSILHLTNIKKKKKQYAIWYFTVNNDGYTLNTKRKEKKGENDFDVFFNWHENDNEQARQEAGFDKLEKQALEKNNFISLPNVYKTFTFNSKYTITPIKELIEEVNIKNKDNYPVWSVTNKNGGTFIKQEAMFDDRVASENITHYKIVPPNAFAYSPPRINIGSIAYNNTQNMGCVSPMYIVFNIKNEKQLAPKYLWWLLQSNQLKKQIKTYAYGSVRQTLTFHDFGKITIPLCSFATQKAIVKELESYQTIIDSAKKIMASWKPFFHIKDEWEQVRVGEVCDVNPRKAKVHSMRSNISFLPMEDVQAYDIYTSAVKTKTMREVQSGYRYMQDGDLLIAKITPCFENGKMSIVHGLKEGFGFGSTEFIVVRPKKDICIAWVYYCLRKLPFLEEGMSMMAGSVGQKRIKPGFVSNYTMPLPPLQEQQKIVAGLETERGLIEGQKKVIATFEAKMQNSLNRLWQG